MKFWKEKVARTQTENFRMKKNVAGSERAIARYKKNVKLWRKAKAVDFFFVKEGGSFTSLNGR